MGHLHDFLHIGKGDTFIKQYSFGTHINQKEIKIFLVLSVKQKKTFTEAMSERIYEQAKEVFYESEASDAYKRFIKILKRCNDVLVKYRKEENEDRDFDLAMVAVMLEGKNIHASKIGAGEAHLVRANHLNEVFDDNAASQTFDDVVSGTVSTDDVLILNTGKLLRYITKSEILDGINNENSLELALHAVKKIIAEETHDQIGITLVHIDGEKAPAKKGSQKFKHWVQAIKDTGLNKEKILKGVQTLKAQAKDLLGKKEGDSADAKKKRLLMSLIGISLVLLITIVVVRFSGSKQQLIKGYETVLTEIEQDIDKASTLAITDKESAKSLLDRAEERSREILASGYLRRLTSARLDQIQEVRNQIDGITTINELKLVADLAEKSPSSNILGLAQYTKHFAAYEQNKISEVILNKVEDPKILDDADQFIAGTYFADQESVVLLTEGNRIIEYANGLFTYMDTKDSKWKPAVALKTYDTKLYLVDSTNNQVWRYVRSNDSYGKAASYFGKDVDLTNVTDIAIDGNIFLLRSDGTIEKYYGGDKVAMKINKAPLSKLESPTRIHTDKDSNTLYVLDPGQRKIFVYAKDPRSNNITYQSQLYFKTLDTLRDFYVDSSSGKMYVADTTKVYEVKL